METCVFRYESRGSDQVSCTLLDLSNRVVYCTLRSAQRQLHYKNNANVVVIQWTKGRNTHNNKVDLWQGVGTVLRNNYKKIMTATVYFFKPQKNSPFLEISRFCFNLSPKTQRTTVFERCVGAKINNNGSTYGGDRTTHSRAFVAN